MGIAARYVILLATLPVVLASCGREEPEAVGCFVNGPGSTSKLVPPDAPFAERYWAVGDTIRATADPDLLLAAMCAQAQNPTEHCHRQQSPEVRQQCEAAGGDAATCAWVGSPLMSRDPAFRPDLEDTCRCLALDAEWCEAAIRNGEQQATRSVARWQDRQSYISACRPWAPWPCWWLLREVVGYPVDGPAVTAWSKRVLAQKIAQHIAGQRAADAPR